MSKSRLLPKLTIREILAKRRLDLGLTHEVIADYLGIKSPEFIGMVEKGKRSFDLDRIPLLADVLRFKREDLLRIALAESSPLAYDALFRASPLDPRNQGSGSRPVVRQEAQELLDLFYSLPEVDREQTKRSLQEKVYGKKKQ